MFLFFFLFCSMLLLCSFFRLKELFQVNVITFLGGRGVGWKMLSGEKKEDDYIFYVCQFYLAKRNWKFSTIKSIFKKLWQRYWSKIIDNNLPVSMFIDFHLINWFYWLLLIVIDYWLCWLHLSGRMHVVRINVLFKVLLAVFVNNISLPGMMFFSLVTKWSDGFPNAILLLPFTVVFVVLGIGWDFINHHQK